MDSFCPPPAPIGDAGAAFSADGRQNIEGVVSRPESVAGNWVPHKPALRVDPPSMGAANPEQTRGLAAGAIPCVSHTDRLNYDTPVAKKVAFRDWARHVFHGKGGRARRDRRFRRCVLNTRLRHEASGPKELFHRESPTA